MITNNLVYGVGVNQILSAPNKYGIDTNEVFTNALKTDFKFHLDEFADIASFKGITESTIRTVLTPCIRQFDRVFDSSATFVFVKHVFRNAAFIAQFIRLYTLVNDSDGKVDSRLLRNTWVDHTLDSYQERGATNIPTRENFARRFNNNYNAGRRMVDFYERFGLGVIFLTKIFNKTLLHLSHDYYSKSILDAYSNNKEFSIHLDNWKKNHFKKLCEHFGLNGLEQEIIEFRQQ